MDINTLKVKGNPLQYEMFVAYSKKQLSNDDEVISKLGQWLEDFIRHNTNVVEIDLWNEIHDYAASTGDLTPLLALYYLEDLDKHRVDKIITAVLSQFSISSDIKISYKGKSYGVPDNEFILKSENISSPKLIIDNNQLLLSCEIEKKRGNDVITEKVIQFVCEFLAIEHIHNPIDKIETPYILAKRIKASEFETVEVLDYSEIEKIYSSHIISLLKKDILLLNTIKNAVLSVIRKKAVNTTKIIGFGIIDNNGSIIIPDSYKTGDIVFCEDYEKFRKLILENKNIEKLYNYEKRLLITNLSIFNKPHNLLTIGAFFASHIFHIVKPSIVPPVLIWGDSKVGKTSIAMLLAYANPSSSQTTAHQLLQSISGFRNGICYFDEKTEWSNQLVQELKYSSTNLAYFHRRSNNKQYIANMLILATSNPKPRFYVRGLEDLKGIIRRTIFLRVDKDKDSLENTSVAETAYSYLDLNRAKLIKCLLDELLEFSVDEINELYKSTMNYEEKYRLIITGLEIWKKICKKYNIDLEIDYNYLLERCKESESEIIGFGDVDITALMRTAIEKVMLDVAMKSIKTDRRLDMDWIVQDKTVVKNTLRAYGFAIYDSKIVFTVQGYKNLRTFCKELPDLVDGKDIERFLNDINVEFERKLAKVCGVVGKFFMIKIHDIEKDEDEAIDYELAVANIKTRIESEIIRLLKNSSKPMNLIDICEEVKKTYDIDDEEIEKILKELVKYGDICEVGPGKYVLC